MSYEAISLRQANLRPRTINPPTSSPMSDLRTRIEQLFALAPSELPVDEANSVFAELKAALNTGRVRSAEPDGSGGWRVNAWVKQGILVGFRAGTLVEMPVGDAQFFDKHNLPLRRFSVDDNV